MVRGFTAQRIVEVIVLDANYNLQKADVHHFEMHNGASAVVTLVWVAAIHQDSMSEVQSVMPGQPSVIDGRKGTQRWKYKSVRTASVLWSRSFVDVKTADERP